MFQKSHLEIQSTIDGVRAVQNRGSFSLHPGGEQNFFDYKGVKAHAGQNEQKLEWFGIYEFEGGFLNICIRIRYLPDEPVPDRPNSFVPLHGRTTSIKLRRTTD